MTKPRRGWDPFLTFPAIGGLLLGAVGLSGGFYGQVGTTALPLGAALGVVVGLAAAILNWRIPAFLATLIVSGAALTAADLYWRLPEDRAQGFIVDAEVRGCDIPAALVGEAVARWERSNVADAGWRSPRAGWKEELPRMLENDRGVVLTLLVHRKRDVAEQRKPWNTGELSATRWDSVEKVDRYFARFAGPTCAGYPSGGRRFFSPEWEASAVSPPDVLPSFLGMFVLQDVPPRFQPFARP
jgi:hypothetical protein